MKKIKIAPMAYTYIMKNIYDWYIADDAAKRAEITEKLAEFKRSKYKYTGIEFYDEGIKYLPKMPEEITEDIHYFRNKLNIEYEWKDFEKLNKRLPEEYKWVKLTLSESAMHQYTAPIYKLKFNKKYISFDGYFEVVYSYNNNLLTEGTGDSDMGTYNYSSHKSKNGNELTHALKDVLPYNLYGNTFADLINK